MGATLYFLRHGQTAYSQTGGYCGTPANDPGLTPEGFLMAKAFADAYGETPWQGIYSSPLKRTIQTAQPLCDRLGMPIQLRDGLKEVGYGLWEGWHPDDLMREFHDEYMQWLTDPAWHAPPGGERGIEIARRSELVLEEIEHTYGGGNVLIVSHKATIRIVLCQLMGLDVGRYRDRFEMPVAAVSVVELAERGPKFWTIGDRSYLSAELRSLPST
jgi:probable phosphoglycerate mutase